MDDLARWLGEQLGEDERIARAAAEPEKWIELNRAPHLHWSVEYWADPDRAAVVAEESSAYPVVVTAEGMNEADAEARAVHVAEHDPARVLRETAAKRQLLDDYVLTARIRDEAAARIKAAGDYPNPKDLEDWDRAQREAAILEGPVRLAASPLSHRPGYREEWRP